MYASGTLSLCFKLHMVCLYVNCYMHSAVLEPRPQQNVNAELQLTIQYELTHLQLIPENCEFTMKIALP